MNKKTLGVLLVFLLLIGVLVGAAIYFGKTLQKTASLQTENNGAIRQREIQEETAVAECPKAEIQEELEQLSEQMLSDLHADRRLNLSMVGQLRAYTRMAKEMETYAAGVEEQIAIIEEIAKDEFQEDVTLQASLFSGKKPDLVAAHLEEFRASRVGAILAKMKDKEASAVLDVWAKRDDPRTSAFYREAMAAYLNNKRRDLHPELFPNGGSRADGVADSSDQTQE